MNSSLNYFILHCSLIEGVGPIAVQQLLNLTKTIPIQELYRFNHIDFMRYRFSDSIAQKLVTRLQSHKLLDDELQAIERYKAQWTIIGSDDYPQLLTSIH